MGARAVRVLVTGRVQGVFFRQSTADRARSAGLAGWVRNLPDGRVEAVLQGLPDAVGDVLAWIRAGGPPAAVVDAVEVEDTPPDATASSFDIRR